MRAVNGIFAIFSEKIFRLKIVEVFVSLFDQLFENFPQAGVRRLVTVGPTRNQEGGRVGDAFDKKNRCFRMFFPEDFNKIREFFADLAWSNIRQRIEDEKRRIEFSDQLGNFRLTSAISGETEIDQRIIEASSENRRICHSRARCTSALQDRSAVKDNWFQITLGTVLKRVAGWNPDFDRFNAVVKREIKTEFAGFGRKVFKERAVVGDVVARTADCEKTPLIFVSDIKIKPADAGRRHVIHREPLFEKSPTDPKSWSIGCELEIKSGRIPTQIPNRGTDQFLGAIGQTGEWTRCFLPALTPNMEIGFGKPEPIILIGICRFVGSDGDQRKEENGGKEKKSGEQHTVRSHSVFGLKQSHFLFIL